MGHRKIAQARFSPMTESHPTVCGVESSHCAVMNVASQCECVVVLSYRVFVSALLHDGVKQTCEYLQQWFLNMRL